ncbi:glucose-1-phosphate cytidylyltransferase [Azospirillum doebereinerae]|uniref:Glucose-1-phosphate cytidylyltransferase n=1 Tax=Azospirillum doebereinerae TaxID=92933 RepID=A0A3S0V0C6_9PROT|nr:glucose-1-phosphate cytidylyltransferase [Azospirillum doebereinerae]MCG5238953.1 glucose-1-phosphate cytidylyltransferase [Azospirillum doebereinerae]RUQ68821.1 glucose-1-phosphate cytidylyltransferase [Azospirillum doebereinerae]
MKAVILAGGYGTRISEESSTRPKPMIEIGGRPILWHIMKIYTHYGITDFLICLGYKGYVIKEYFFNYALHMSDVTIDMANKSMSTHQSSTEPWKVTLVDTGEETMTGGRLRRIRDYVGNEPFCMTYGDGVADVDVDKLVDFHRSHGRLATVTAVRPPGRFGQLEIEDNRVTGFQEKPLGDGSWINGGFFVLDPRTLDYIAGDDSIWEQEPMKRLAAEGQLASFRHDGFWRPMDTLRDKTHLEELWQSKSAPWRKWS